MILLNHCLYLFLLFLSSCHRKTFAIMHKTFEIQTRFRGKGIASPAHATTILQPSRVKLPLSDFPNTQQRCHRHVQSHDYCHLARRNSLVHVVKASSIIVKYCYQHD